MPLNKKAISVLLSITVALTAVVAVWADYTGPNRTTTVTVYQRKECHYQAIYDPAGPGVYSCTLNLYVAPDDSCPSTGSVAAYFNPGACSGWPGSCTTLPCNISRSSSIEGCSPGQEGCTGVQQTQNLPPATISGSFVCSIPGNNGWCRGGGLLNLSASEPLGGYVITSIEGDPGGLCDPPDAANVSCSWGGGGEGNYGISFWANSSYGDQSNQSSATWRQDTVPPSGSVNVSGGTAGGGGWYRGGPLTVSAGGSDSTSGFAGGQVSVAGGPWMSSASINTDGIYGVDVQPVDNAGNVGSGSGTVRLDNTPPTLTTNVSGTIGNGGWYVTGVTATANGSDGLSGIASRQIQVNGGAWQNSPYTFSNDGSHSINFRAVDVAGNTTSGGPSSVSIDATPPNVTQTLAGTLGSGGWYITNVTVNSSGNDDTSGLSTFQMRFDSGSWQNTNSIMVGEGTHTVRSRGTDMAGNTQTVQNAVNVDLTDPTISPSVSNLGGGGWYRSGATATAGGADSVSGVATQEVRVDGVWRTSPYTITGDGIHTLEYRVRDNAGREVTGGSTTINLDATAPTVSQTVTGTLGLNGWYVSQATVETSASDVTSGLSTIESRIDSQTWQPSSAINVGEGSHMVTGRALDVAGNEASATVSVNVDLSSPVLNTSFTGTSGSGGWYTSGGNAIGNASDGVSGVALQEYRVDGGSWQTGSTTVVSGDGTHTVEWHAEDYAGLETNYTQTVRIDTAPPSSTFIQPGEGSTSTVAGTLAMRGTSSDNTSGVGGTEISLNGGDSWNILSSGSGLWSYSWDTRAIPNGTYTVLVRATDRAGNLESTARITVIVQNAPPTKTPTPLPPTPTGTSTTTPTPTDKPNIIEKIFGSKATEQPLQIAMAPIEGEAPQRKLPPQEPEAIVMQPEILTWPLGVGVSVAIFLGASSLLDRRPRAWRRLGDIRRESMWVEDARKQSEGTE